MLTGAAAAAAAEDDDDDADDDGDDDDEEGGEEGGGGVAAVAAHSRSSIGRNSSPSVAPVSYAHAPTPVRKPILGTMEDHQDHS